MSDVKHVGLFENRLNRDNPREVAFAQAWQKENDFHHTLEYLLSEDPNRRCQPTEREIEVAATVVQWLGSNVGMAFLEDVIKSNTKIQHWIKCV